MIWKNSAPGCLTPRLTGRLMLDAIAIGRSLSGLKLKECFAIIRGHLHFYRSLPMLTKQRKYLASQRVTTDDTRVLAPWSIIWHYFFRKRKTYQQLPVLEIDRQSD